MKHLPKKSGLNPSYSITQILSTTIEYRADPRRTAKGGRCVEVIMTSSLSMIRNNNIPTPISRPRIPKLSLTSRPYISPPQETILNKAHPSLPLHNLLLQRRRTPLSNSASVLPLRQRYHHYRILELPSLTRRDIVPPDTKPERIHQKHKCQVQDTSEERQQKAESPCIAVSGATEACDRAVHTLIRLVQVFNIENPLAAQPVGVLGGRSGAVRIRHDPRHGTGNLVSVG